LGFPPKKLTIRGGSTKSAQEKAVLSTNHEAKSSYYLEQADNKKRGRTNTNSEDTGKFLLTGLADLHKNIAEKFLLPE
jgi:alpha-D-ribose 1-methylphosphonate 5-triphosphate diphosphatase PhnM